MTRRTSRSSSAANLDTVTLLLRPRLAVATAGASDGHAAARALSTAHFALVTRRRVAIAHLLGVVLALEDRVLEEEEGTRPTSAPEIVQAYQARVHAALTDAYRDLLERWGRTPRPGTDLEQIVDLVAALADGVALRRLVDPEGASGDEFRARRGRPPGGAHLRRIARQERRRTPSRFRGPSRWSRGPSTSLLAPRSSPRLRAALGVNGSARCSPSVPGGRQRHADLDQHRHRGCARRLG